MKQNNRPDSHNLRMCESPRNYNMLFACVLFNYRKGVAFGRRCCGSFYSCRVAKRRHAVFIGQGVPKRIITNVIRTSEGWLCFLTPACSFPFLTCLCPTVGRVSARSAIAGPSKGRDRVFVSPETSCFRISRRSDALPIVRNHSGRNSQGMRSGTREQRCLRSDCHNTMAGRVGEAKLVGLNHSRQIDDPRE